MSALPVPRLGFLGARKLLQTTTGGAPLPLTLAASGQIEPLLLYVRAHAAQLGFAAALRTLPFGTLAQHLHGAPDGAPEAILITPWDFVGELDCRSGVPGEAPAFDDCVTRARAVAARLAGRLRAALLYLPAATPPLFSDPALDRDLARALSILALELKARILAPEAFALGPYLATGCPIAGAALEEVGVAIAEAGVDLVATRPEPAKALVTDLDNVMWHGVIGEDGVDGIAYGQEGSGWRHFLYQTVLKRLRAEGVLIAAVSRNRPEDATAPFRQGRMVLGEDDLVTVIASYHAKSAQIRRLAEELNLGLDALLFIDDNPVELAEVERELPTVRRLQFPGDEARFPEFLAAIAGHFARSKVTEEDRRRTALYRQRLATLVPDTSSGGDLTDFLRGLAMRLVIRDRSAGDRTRAVQLINKTNQFNLNGRRVEDAAVAGLLAAGGRLFTGELTDRTGSHGEVLALLVDGDGLVESFVMSCRVFQRRAEHAFLTAIAASGVAVRGLNFAATDRNEPLQTFLAAPGFAKGGEDPVAVDIAAFVAAHATELGLITVTWAEPA